MPWYDEAVFYHIYPLGLLGAPRENPYGEPEHRLPALVPWLDHLRGLGVTALYIGPLFQSVGHGYETTDYRLVDTRLGTNEDLRDLVAAAHNRGIRVVLDGVFNHVGRDFFAFRDLLEHRESSAYRDWFCNVDFGGNSSYNDGLSYDTWGGYDLLVKLNQGNPAVRDYLLDTVRFWVDEFDIDGIRLDTADVLDFDFMHALRAVANTVKPDFWLMGEVIHGEYSRWVNGDTLHAVTNYSLHKALYSGHNDHNYFEIAHTVKRNYDMGGDRVEGLRLYNFVDNHDVDRIWTKLDDKRHFEPVHVLMYTLPGAPSIYYGSEFAIEGKRTNYADDMLRPALDLADFEGSSFARLLAQLGRVRHETPALSYGEYRELALTNRQYAFARTLEGGDSAIVSVNNDDGPATVTVDALGRPAYAGALAGRTVSAHDGVVDLPMEACSGEVWRPVDGDGGEGSSDGGAAAAAEAAREAQRRMREEAERRRAEEEACAAEARAAEQGLLDRAREAVARTAEGAADRPEDRETPELSRDFLLGRVKPFEDMTVQELQLSVLAQMAMRGPVTEQMRRDVAENTYHDSLVNWAKSFN
ncbi:alpha-amylase family glycosyl hydrolase [Atopobiaceae bacterium 24-176]